MIDVHSLRIVLTFLGYLSLFAFCGVVLAKIWLVPAHAFQQTGVFLRWRQMLNECLAVLAFAGAAILLAYTAEIDDATPPGMLLDIPKIITRTHFGLIWAVHLATLLVIWIGCTVMTSRLASRRWSALMVAGLLALAFTYSASSHASDSGDFTLAELADWVHVAATAAWGGSILISAALIFPLLRDQHSIISVAAGRLSTLAGSALPFALVTGIYNSSVQLRSVGSLLHTTYGRLLTAKLAVVVTLVLIGALNRFVIASRIRRYPLGNPAVLDRPLRLLSQALAVDAVLVLLAITMAAILGQYETT